MPDEGTVVVASPVMEEQAWRTAEREEVGYYLDSACPFGVVYILDAARLRAFPLPWSA